jgi:hypothetical protein
MTPLKICNYELGKKNIRARISKRKTRLLWCNGKESMDLRSHRKQVNNILPKIRPQKKSYRTKKMYLF